MSFRKKMHMKCNWKRVFLSDIKNRSDEIDSFNLFNRVKSYKIKENIFPSNERNNIRLFICQYDMTFWCDNMLFTYDILKNELSVEDKSYILLKKIDIQMFYYTYNLLNRYVFNPEYYKLFLFVCGNKKLPKELLITLKDFLCI